MKKFNLIFLVVISILLACQKSSRIPVVDLDAVPEVTELSDYISQVQFVPLEESEHSFVGTPTDIEINKDRIVVRTREQQDVLTIFDREGEFVGKITSAEKGAPGFYRRSYDADLPGNIKDLDRCNSISRVINSSIILTTESTKKTRRAQLENP